MTIDEAIKHAEEVMVENLEKTKGRNASDPIALNCFKCAEEHRQLAEWLKELKAYKEQTDGDLISRQAVLKILSENRFRYNIAKEGYNEGQVLWSENLYTDNVRTKIEKLPSAEKTAEWISVRKQKPEDYEEVIVTVRYDYKNKQEYEVVTGVRYSKEEGWEWAYEAGSDYWESINGVVVAWQPLPMPYEVKR